MQQEKNYMPIHDEDHDRIIKGQTNGLSLEMAIYNAGYERGKAQHTSGREWVKNALQWAKEAIECASQHLECPQPWVETWGNHYMNAMAAIQQAQCEIEPNGEVARKAQEAFLPGQTDESPSKEGNPKNEFVEILDNALDAGKQVLDELRKQNSEKEGNKEREDWIDVNDRLPYKDGDSSVYCIVYDSYWGVVVRPFNEAHNCWDGEDGDDYYTDAKGGIITHWKPLPESPFRQQKG